MLALVLCFQQAPRASAQEKTTSPTVPSEAGPSALLSLALPDHLGKVTETFQGTSPQAVVLLEDAHANYDAQKSIAAVLDYLAGLGIRRAAVEGGVGKLDAAFLRAVPEKKLLADFLDELMRRGELSGAAVSAVFGPGLLEYSGLEDRDLYESEIRSFLEASAAIPEAARETARLRSSLENEKKTKYSRGLAEFDSEREAFEEGRLLLHEFLLKLAGLHSPDSYEAVKSVISEIRNSRLSGGAEIRGALAAYGGEIRTKLSSKDAAQEYTEKKQAYDTGRLDEPGFAVFLSRLSEKYRLGVPVPGALSDLIRSRSLFEDMKGPVFLRELALYTEETASSLIRTPEERRLYDASRRAALLDRLSSLKLSRDEWETLKKDASLSDEKTLKAAVRFYEIAEQREKVFLKKTLGLFDDKIHAVALLSGGFHTRSLAAEFRRLGITNVIITPAIEELPAEDRYGEVMKGNVSWRSGIKADHGRVNLYDSFNRAAASQLSRAGGMQFLKAWRDGIIRDLASRGTIAGAGDYTRYIDEAAAHLIDDGDAKSVLEKWKGRLERFVSGLERLHESRGLDDAAVAKLFSATASAPYANPLFRGLEFSSQILGTEPLSVSAAAPAAPTAAPLAAPARSETRAQPFDTGNPALELVRVRLKDIKAFRSLSALERGAQIDAMNRRLSELEGNLAESARRAEYEFLQHRIPAIYAPVHEQEKIDAEALIHNVLQDIALDPAVPEHVKKAISMTPFFKAAGILLDRLEPQPADARWDQYPLGQVNAEDLERVFLRLVQSSLYVPYAESLLRNTAPAEAGRGEKLAGGEARFTIREINGKEIFAAAEGARLSDPELQTGLDEVFRELFQQRFYLPAEMAALGFVEVRRGPDAPVRYESKEEAFSARAADFDPGAAARPRLVLDEAMLRAAAKDPAARRILIREIETVLRQILLRPFLAEADQPAVFGGASVPAEARPAALLKLAAMRWNVMRFLSESRDDREAELAYLDHNAGLDTNGYRGLLRAAHEKLSEGLGPVETADFLTLQSEPDAGALVPFLSSSYGGDMASGFATLGNSGERLAAVHQMEEALERERLEREVNQFERFGYYTNAPPADFWRHAPRALGRRLVEQLARTVQDERRAALLREFGAAYLFSIRPHQLFVKDFQESAPFPGSAHPDKLTALLEHYTTASSDDLRISRLLEALGFYDPALGYGLPKRIFEWPKEYSDRTHIHPERVRAMVSLLDFLAGDALTGRPGHDWDESTLVFAETPARTVKSLIADQNFARNPWIETYAKSRLYSRFGAFGELGFTMNGLLGDLRDNFFELLQLSSAVRALRKYEEARARGVQEEISAFEDALADYQPASGLEGLMKSAGALIKSAAFQEQPFRDQHDLVSIYDVKSRLYSGLLLSGIRAVYFWQHLIRQAMREMRNSEILAAREKFGLGEPAAEYHPAKVFEEGGRPVLGILTDAAGRKITGILRYAYDAEGKLTHTDLAPLLKERTNFDPAITLEAVRAVEGTLYGPGTSTRRFYTTDGPMLEIAVDASKSAVTAVRRFTKTGSGALIEDPLVMITDNYPFHAEWNLSQWLDHEAPKVRPEDEIAVPQEQLKKTYSKKGKRYLTIHYGKESGAVTGVEAYLHPDNEDEPIIGDRFEIVDHEVPVVDDMTADDWVEMQKTETSPPGTYLFSDRTVSRTFYRREKAKGKKAAEIVPVLTIHMDPETGKITRFDEYSDRGELTTASEVKPVLDFDDRSVDDWRNLHARIMRGEEPGILMKRMYYHKEEIPALTVEIEPSDTGAGTVAQLIHVLSKNGKKYEVRQTPARIGKIEYGDRDWIGGYFPVFSDEPDLSALDALTQEISHQYDRDLRLIDNAVAGYRHFIAAEPEDISLDPQDAVALESLIEQVLDPAFRAWTGLDIPFTKFQDFLATRARLAIRYEQTLDMTGDEMNAALEFPYERDFLPEQRVDADAAAGLAQAALKVKAETRSELRGLIRTLGGRELGSKVEPRHNAEKALIRRLGGNPQGYQGNFFSAARGNTVSGWQSALWLADYIHENLNGTLKHALDDESLSLLYGAFRQKGYVTAAEAANLADEERPRARLMPDVITDLQPDAVLYQANAGEQPADWPAGRPWHRDQHWNTTVRHESLETFAANRQQHRRHQLITSIFGMNDLLSAPDHPERDRAVRNKFLAAARLLRNGGLFAVTLSADKGFTNDALEAMRRLGFEVEVEGIGYNRLTAESRNRLYENENALVDAENTIRQQMFYVLVLRKVRHVPDEAAARVPLEDLKISEFSARIEVPAATENREEEEGQIRIRSRADRDRMITGLRASDLEAADLIPRSREAREHPAEEAVIHRRYTRRDADRDRFRYYAEKLRLIQKYRKFMFDPGVPSDKRRLFLDLLNRTFDPPHDRDSFATGRRAAGAEGHWTAEKAAWTLDAAALSRTFTDAAGRPVLSIHYRPGEAGRAVLTGVSIHETDGEGRITYTEPRKLLVEAHEFDPANPGTLEDWRAAAGTIYSPHAVDFEAVAKRSREMYALIERAYKVFEDVYPAFRKYPDLDTWFTDELGQSVWQLRDRDFAFPHLEQRQFIEEIYRVWQNLERKLTTGTADQPGDVEKLLALRQMVRDFRNAFQEFGRVFAHGRAGGARGAEGRRRNPWQTEEDRHSLFLQGIASFLSAMSGARYVGRMLEARGGRLRLGDLASGSGALAHALGKLGILPRPDGRNFVYHELDINQAYLNQPRPEGYQSTDKGGPVVQTLGDVTALPAAYPASVPADPAHPETAAEPFDLLTAFYIVDMLTPEQVKQMFIGANQVLATPGEGRPGGEFYLTVPQSWRISPAFLEALEKLGYEVTTPVRGSQKAREEWLDRIRENYPEDQYPAVTIGGRRMPYGEFIAQEARRMREKQFTILKLRKKEHINLNDAARRQLIDSIDAEEAFVLEKTETGQRAGTGGKPFRYDQEEMLRKIEIYQWVLRWWGPEDVDVFDPDPDQDYVTREEAAAIFTGAGLSIDEAVGDLYRYRFLFSREETDNKPYELIHSMHVYWNAGSAHFLRRDIETLRDLYEKGPPNVPGNGSTPGTFALRWAVGKLEGSAKYYANLAAKKPRSREWNQGLAREAEAAARALENAIRTLKDPQKIDPDLYLLWPEDSAERKFFRELRQTGENAKTLSVRKLGWLDRFLAEDHEGENLLAAMRRGAAEPGVRKPPPGAKPDAKKPRAPAPRPLELKNPEKTRFDPASPGVQQDAYDVVDQIAARFTSNRIDVPGVAAKPGYLPNEADVWHVINARPVWLRLPPEFLDADFNADTKTQDLIRRALLVRMNLHILGRAQTTLGQLAYRLRYPEKNLAFNYVVRSADPPNGDRGEYLVPVVELDGEGKIQTLVFFEEGPLPLYLKPEASLEDQQRMTGILFQAQRMKTLRNALPDGQETAPGFRVEVHQVQPDGKEAVWKTFPSLDQVEFPKAGEFLSDVPGTGGRLLETYKKLEEGYRRILDYRMQLNQPAGVELELQVLSEKSAQTQRFLAAALHIARSTLVTRADPVRFSDWLTKSLDDAVLPLLSSGMGDVAATRVRPAEHGRLITEVGATLQNLSEQLDMNAVRIAAGEVRDTEDFFFLMYDPARDLYLPRSGFHLNDYRELYWKAYRAKETGILRSEIRPGQTAMDLDMARDVSMAAFLAQSNARLPLWTLNAREVDVLRSYVKNFLRSGPKERPRIENELRAFIYAGSTPEAVNARFREAEALMIDETYSEDYAPGSLAAYAAFTDRLYAERISGETLASLYAKTQLLEEAGAAGPENQSPAARHYLIYRALTEWRSFMNSFSRFVEQERRAGNLSGGPALLPGGILLTRHVDNPWLKPYKAPEFNAYHEALMARRSGVKILENLMLSGSFDPLKARAAADPVERWGLLQELLDGEAGEKRRPSPAGVQQNFVQASVTILRFIAPMLQDVDEVFNYAFQTLRQDSAIFSSQGMVYLARLNELLASPDQRELFTRRLTEKIDTGETWAQFIKNSTIDLTRPEYGRILEAMVSGILSSDTRVSRAYTVFLGSYLHRIFAAPALPDARQKAEALLRRIFREILERQGFDFEKYAGQVFLLTGLTDDVNAHSLLAAELEAALRNASFSISADEVEKLAWKIERWVTGLQELQAKQGIRKPAALGLLLGNEGRASKADTRFWRVAAEAYEREENEKEEGLPPLADWLKNDEVQKDLYALVRSAAEDWEKKTDEEIEKLSPEAQGRSGRFPAFEDVLALLARENRLRADPVLEKAGVADPLLRGALERHYEIYRLERTREWAVKAFGMAVLRVSAPESLLSFDIVRSTRITGQQQPKDGGPAVRIEAVKSAGTPGQPSYQGEYYVAYGPDRAPWHDHPEADFNDEFFGVFTESTSTLAGLAGGAGVSSKLTFRMLALNSPQELIRRSGLIPGESVPFTDLEHTLSHGIVESEVPDIRVFAASFMEVLRYLKSPAVRAETLESTDEIVQAREKLEKIGGLFHHALRQGDELFEQRMPANGTEGAAILRPVFEETFRYVSAVLAGEPGASDKGAAGVLPQGYIARVLSPKADGVIPSKALWGEITKHSQAEIARGAQVSEKDLTAAIARSNAQAGIRIWHISEAEKERIRGDIRRALQTGSPETRRKIIEDLGRYISLRNTLSRKWYAHAAMLDELTNELNFSRDPEKTWREHRTGAFQRMSETSSLVMGRIRRDPVAPAEVLMEVQLLGEAAQSAGSRAEAAIYGAEAERIFNKLSTFLLNSRLQTTGSLEPVLEKLIRDHSTNPALDYYKDPFRAATPEGPETAAVKALADELWTTKDWDRLAAYTAESKENRLELFEELARRAVVNSVYVDRLRRGLPGEEPAFFTFEDKVMKAVADHISSVEEMTDLLAIGNRYAKPSINFRVGFFYEALGRLLKDKIHEDAFRHMLVSSSQSAALFGYSLMAAYSKELAFEKMPELGRILRENIFDSGNPRLALSSLLIAVHYAKGLKAGQGSAEPLAVDYLKALVHDLLAEEGFRYGRILPLLHAVYPDLPGKPGVILEPALQVFREGIEAGDPARADLAEADRLLDLLAVYQTNFTAQLPASDAALGVKSGDERTAFERIADEDLARYNEIVPENLRRSEHRPAPEEPTEEQIRKIFSGKWEALLRYGMEADAKLPDGHPDRNKTFWTILHLARASQGKIPDGDYARLAELSGLSREDFDRRVAESAPAAAAPSPAAPLSPAEALAGAIAYAKEHGEDRAWKVTGEERAKIRGLWRRLLNAPDDNAARDVEEEIIRYVLAANTDVRHFLLNPLLQHELSAGAYGGNLPMKSRKSLEKILSRVDQKAPKDEDPVMKVFRETKMYFEILEDPLSPEDEKFAAQASLVLGFPTFTEIFRRNHNILAASEIINQGLAEADPAFAYFSSLYTEGTLGSGPELADAQSMTERVLAGGRIEDAGMIRRIGEDRAFRAAVLGQLTKEGRLGKMREAKGVLAAGRLIELIAANAESVLEILHLAAIVRTSPGKSWERAVQPLLQRLESLVSTEEGEKALHHVLASRFYSRQILAWMLFEKGEGHAFIVYPALRQALLDASRSPNPALSTAAMSTVAYVVKTADDLHDKGVMTPEYEAAVREDAADLMKEMIGAFVQRAGFDVDAYKVFFREFAGLLEMQFPEIGAWIREAGISVLREKAAAGSPDALRWKRYETMLEQLKSWQRTNRGEINSILGRRNEDTPGEIAREAAGLSAALDSIRRNLESHIDTPRVREEVANAVSDAVREYENVYLYFPANFESLYPFLSASGRFDYLPALHHLDLAPGSPWRAAFEREFRRQLYLYRVSETYRVTVQRELGNKYDAGRVAFNYMARLRRGNEVYRVRLDAVLFDEHGKIEKVFMFPVAEGAPGSPKHKEAVRGAILHVARLRTLLASPDVSEEAARFAGAEMVLSFPHDEDNQDILAGMPAGVRRGISIVPAQALVPSAMVAGLDQAVRMAAAFGHTMNFIRQGLEAADSEGAEVSDYELQKFRIYMRVTRLQLLQIHDFKKNMPRDHAEKRDAILRTVEPIKRIFELLTDGRADEAVTELEALERDATRTLDTGGETFVYYDPFPEQGRPGNVSERKRDFPVAGETELRLIFTEPVPGMPKKMGPGDAAGIEFAGRLFADIQLWHITPEEITDIGQFIKAMLDAAESAVSPEARDEAVWREMERLRGYVNAANSASRLAVVSLEGSAASGNYSVETIDTVQEAIAEGIMPALSKAAPADKLLNLQVYRQAMPDPAVNLQVRMEMAAISAYVMPGILNAIKSAGINPYKTVSDTGNPVFSRWDPDKKFRDDTGPVHRVLLQSSIIFVSGKIAERSAEFVAAAREFEELLAEPGNRRELSHILKEYQWAAEFVARLMLLQIQSGSSENILAAMKEFISSDDPELAMEAANAVILQHNESLPIVSTNKAQSYAFMLSVAATLLARHGLDASRYYGALDMIRQQVAAAPAFRTVIDEAFRTAAMRASSLAELEEAKRGAVRLLTLIAGSQGMTREAFEREYLGVDPADKGKGNRFDRILVQHEDLKEHYFRLFEAGHDITGEAAQREFYDHVRAVAFDMAEGNLRGVKPSRLKSRIFHFPEWEDVVQALRKENGRADLADGSPVYEQYRLAYYRLRYRRALEDNARVLSQMVYRWTVPGSQPLRFDYRLRMRGGEPDHRMDVVAAREQTQQVRGRSSYALFLQGMTASRLGVTAWPFEDNPEGSYADDVIGQWMNITRIGTGKESVLSENLDLWNDFSGIHYVSPGPGGDSMRVSRWIERIPDAYAAVKEQLSAIHAALAARASSAPETGDAEKMRTQAEALEAAAETLRFARIQSDNNLANPTPPVLPPEESARVIAAYLRGIVLPAVGAENPETARRFLDENVSKVMVKPGTTTEPAGIPPVYGGGVRTFFDSKGSVIPFVESGARYIPEAERDFPFQEPSRLAADLLGRIEWKLRNGLSLSAEEARLNTPERAVEMLSYTGGTSLWHISGHEMETIRQLVREMLGSNGMARARAAARLRTLVREGGSLGTVATRRIFVYMAAYSELTTGKYPGRISQAEMLVEAAIRDPLERNSDLENALSFYVMQGGAQDERLSVSERMSLWMWSQGPFTKLARGLDGHDSDFPKLFSRKLPYPALRYYQRDDFARRTAALPGGSPGAEEIGAVLERALDGSAPDMDQIVSLARSSALARWRIFQALRSGPRSGPATYESKKTQADQVMFAIADNVETIDEFVNYLYALHRVFLDDRNKTKWPFGGARQERFIARLNDYLLRDEAGISNFQSAMTANVWRSTFLMSLSAHLRPGFFRRYPNVREAIVQSAMSDDPALSFQFVDYLVAQYDTYQAVKLDMREYIEEIMSVGDEITRRFLEKYGDNAARYRMALQIFFLRTKGRDRLMRILRDRFGDELETNDALRGLVQIFDNKAILEGGAVRSEIRRKAEPAGEIAPVPAGAPAESGSAAPVPAAAGISGALEAVSLYVFAGLTAPASVRRGLAELVRSEGAQSVGRKFTERLETLERDREAFASELLAVSTLSAMHDYEIGRQAGAIAGSLAAAGMTNLQDGEAHVAYVTDRLPEAGSLVSALRTRPGLNMLIVLLPEGGYEKSGAAEIARMEKEAASLEAGAASFAGRGGRLRIVVPHSRREAERKISDAASLLYVAGSKAGKSISVSGIRDSLLYVYREDLSSFVTLDGLPGAGSLRHHIRNADAYAGGKQFFLWQTAAEISQKTLSALGGRLLGESPAGPSQSFRYSFLDENIPKDLLADILTEEARIAEYITASA